jgi:hypothetical protein
MLSVVLICFCAECRYAVCRYAECRYAECHYAECHYAESHYAKCYYAECRYAECHYAECRFTECRYSECRGAIFFLINLRLNELSNQASHHCPVVNATKASSALHQNKLDRLSPKIFSRLV